jgi:trimeric autotransporter adhesin
MAIINGDNADNVLVGTNLGDTISGLGGDDVLLGLAGNDFVNGGAGNDELFGQAGNDLLNGGTGADAMTGGAGDDIYIVDSVGDVVTEGGNGGTDRIQSSISLSLNVSGRLDVENLTLTGSAAINGLGNAHNNLMVGNSAENVLSSAAGNDSLFGQGGDDALLAGAGADTLNGGIGADTMNGDVGNDTYVVDQAGDVVIEAVSGGLDRILSSIGQNLTVGGRANVENLTLTGTAAINGTGNALSNVLVGNSADNVLAGLGNSDQLLGLDGNDVLSAGEGNDLVNGGNGSDSIHTGTGSDRVFFDAALGAGNVDAVQDFNPVFDTFLLDDAVFSTLAPGVLAAEAFVVGAAAVDGNDRIVYDSTTGALSYDPDGVGGAAQTEFAQLPGALALTSSDFVVV